MNTLEINRIFDHFANQKVLVIGDVMIDAYLWGKVDRISPEAPVPVVSITKEEERLGGAANVALNITALGGTPIICSVIGNDEKANRFEKLLEKRALTQKGIVNSESRNTTVKTRIISNAQQMLRVDQESEHNLVAEEEAQLLNVIQRILTEDEIDVIIFQDYDKGVLTPSLIQKVIELATQKNISITVDPKKKNFFEYRNVTLFKPNLKELSEGLKMDVDKNSIDSIRNATTELMQRLNNDQALITLSEKGVYIKTNEKEASFPAHFRNISDVSGAGDTVISIASMALAAGATPELIAQLANLGGGLVCEEIGVVPINKENLKAEAIKELTVEN